MITGIYAICSEINGRQYVGSSVNIQKRWGAHRRCLRKGTHHSIHLQRAWDKYGEESFEFVVLEECSVESLVEREQYYMDQTADRYNSAPAAGSARGMVLGPETRAKISAALKGRKDSPETRARKMGNKNAAGYKHTPEARAKMSASRMGHGVSAETRSKMVATNTGRKHTVEARANMSAGQIGRKHSEETKAKMSVARKGHKKSPETRAKMSAAQKLRREQERRSIS